MDLADMEACSSYRTWQHRTKREFLLITEISAIRYINDGHLFSMIMEIMCIGRNGPNSITGFRAPLVVFHNYH